MPPTLFLLSQLGRGRPGLRLFLAFFITWGLAGCAGNTPAIPNLADHQIILVYHEWHTSILLSAPEVDAVSQRLGPTLVNQRYVQVGWGDGDYFTGKRKSFGSATRALFLSGYSAVQVLAWVDSPLVSIPPQTWVPLALSDEGFRRLVTYLDNALALDAEGRLIELPAYEPDTGRFYVARDRYSLVANCNTWTGRALQAAGLPIHSQLHLTARSVFDQARHISILQEARGLIKTPDAGLYHANF